MHKPLQLQKKFRIGAVLLLLLSGIILNNLSSQWNLDKVDTSVTSIYNDRLMAATYLFDISSHLHEKKAMTGTEQAEQQRRIDHEIATLIRQYDQTLLTPKEQVLWASFKAHLQQYNAAAPDASASWFHKATDDLKALSALQARVGNSLFRDTQSGITAFALSANLEIGLVIGLGILTLILIGASRDIVLPFRQRPSLN